LALSLPSLERVPIEFLGEGWAFNAFRAGDTVLRFPKLARFTETLAAEAAIMGELAPKLPLAVSAIDLHENGPDGLPFTAHRLVPGVPVVQLARPLASDAGEVLGRFLRALHDFPVERVAELGMSTPNIAELRDQRSAHYEDVRARMLPLMDRETQAYVQKMYEAYLANPSSFDFTPCLIHADVDGRNTLADPQSGELTGVIDWGDMTIGDPALDLTDILADVLAKAGLKDQMPSFLTAYGISDAELAKLRPRCEFYEFLWPVHIITFALDDGNEAGIQEGVDWLRKAAAEANS
jgi:aminoglycoside phosphotransferase (APT) family kinase protein